MALLAGRAAGVAALSWRGGCPGVCGSAAAAVAAALGRAAVGPCGEFPRARRARLLLVRQALPVMPSTR
jgi:hypothetical protein